MTTQFGLFSPDDNKEHKTKNTTPESPQLSMFSDSETVQFGVTTSRPLMTSILSPDMKLPLMSTPPESDDEKQARNDKEANDKAARMFDPEVPSDEPSPLQNEALEQRDPDSVQWRGSVPFCKTCGRSVITCECEPDPSFDEYSFEWLMIYRYNDPEPVCSVCGNSPAQLRDKFILCDSCWSKTASYRAQQSARADRFEERAEKARAAAESRFDHAHKLGDMIPMGQPILVGHHSERMHRNHLRKIDNNMRKGIEETEKAEHYERRADSARKNRAISSDDPTAIPKLEEKIANLTAKQEMMKRVNRKVRSAQKQAEKGNDPIQWLIDHCDDVTKEETARNLLEPDFAGRVGFASYRLSNNNARIRDAKNRLAEMQRKQDQIASAGGDTVTRETFGDIELERDLDENRLRLYFPGKPDEKTREFLSKSAGFKWSRYNVAWQRHLNNSAEYAASRVIAYVYPNGIPLDDYPTANSTFEYNATEYHFGGNVFNTLTGEVQRARTDIMQQGFKVGDTFELSDFGTPHPTLKNGHVIGFSEDGQYMFALLTCEGHASAYTFRLSYPHWVMNDPNAEYKNRYNAVRSS
jgi:hypothetical protein